MSQWIPLAATVGVALISNASLVDAATTTATTR
jgi:hypothetical protein